MLLIDAMRLQLVNGCAWPEIALQFPAGVGREPFRSLPAGGRLVYCALDEVDALYERVREAGGEIAVEITDTDYGSRDFTVRDPEGNLCAFGTYRPARGR